jgi:hypothetical protein
MVAQEVIGLEMLEAEAGSAGGVDLDDAGGAATGVWAGAAANEAAGGGAEAGVCAWTADAEIKRARANAVRMTIPLRISD